MNRILLGTTKDGCIVFGDYDIKTWNGFPEFTACFDVVRPFSPSQEDIQERLAQYVDSMSTEEIVKQCNDYECCPNDLADAIYDDLGTDDLVELLYDTSFYPDTIYDRFGDEWDFESGAGGQYDPRPDMKTIYDKTLFKGLMYLWDNYHLKKLTEDNTDFKVLEQVEKHAEKWRDACFVEKTIADFINEELL